MTKLRARQLRNAMTDAEVRLWSRLKRLRPHGFHIRRQAPFRGYFLDFVCFDRRVVIEVDGWRHGEDAQLEHDRIRDAVLAREGFEMLRFRNGEIDRNIGGVMDAVITALEAATPTRLAFGDPPSP